MSKYFKKQSLVACILRIFAFHYLLSVEMLSGRTGTARRHDNIRGSVRGTGYLLNTGLCFIFLISVCIQAYNMYLNSVIHKLITRFIKGAVAKFGLFFCLPTHLSEICTQYVNLNQE